MNAQKKVLADQLNARDSSGPKTATRKSNSRRNATKAIDNPHVNNISPRELFERGRDREKQLSTDAFKRLQNLFANQHFFSYPLFDPPHGVSDECRESLSDPGVRYNLLLLLLRNSRTSERRLVILATWLHLEGICQPERSAPRGFLTVPAAGPRGSRGRLSFTDLRQAFIINNWEPYFNQLLLAQRNGLDLRQLGFDESAIRSASRKRSAVAAACDYVCSRLGVHASALANAYSRIFRVKIRNSGFPTQDRQPIS